MDKSMLIGMGLSPETAQKVMAALDGAYVTKARFNEVNSALQELKEKTGAEDENKLEMAEEEILKLRAELAMLKKKSDEREDEFSRILKQSWLDAAVDLALMEAKAKKPETVRPLLASFLETVEGTEKREIPGLKEEICKLIKSEETGFLFFDGPEDCFEGFCPGEGRDTGDSKAPDLRSLSYSELCESFSLGEC